MPSPAGELPGSRSWGSRGNEESGVPRRVPPGRPPLPTWGSPCSSSKGARRLINAHQQLALCSPYGPQSPLLTPAPSPPSPQPPAPAAFSRAALYELRLTSKQPANLACRDN